MEENDDLTSPEALELDALWTLADLPTDGPLPLSTVGELPPLPQWE